MRTHYRDLGNYSDLVDYAGQSRASARMITLPMTATVERSWARDGVQGEEVSWSVGYGPRSIGWVLRPADKREALPGVLALHDHGSLKFYGKEKIADGPEGPIQYLAKFRRRFYGDVAFANNLAREGFVVLVPDVFMWGSRRFDPLMVPGLGTASVSAPTTAAEYDQLANWHEEIVAKYCAILGVSVGQLIAAEDQLAASYLASRTDVVTGGVGCIGLSAGGMRAGLLLANCDKVRAAVVVGMMSTFRALLDRHLNLHSWMVCLPGIASETDWPDLVASRAPSSLLVQYLEDDHLFPIGGMREAHRRLAGAYNATGQPSAYRGEFYPGPHRFDRAMQRSAFEALRNWLLGPL